MSWERYYRQLNKQQRAEYAARAGTSCLYIEIHLMRRKKVPRRDLMERLAEATQGVCSVTDVVAHFYAEDVA